MKPSLWSFQYIYEQIVPKSEHYHVMKYLLTMQLGAVKTGFIEIRNVGTAPRTVN